MVKNIVLLHGWGANSKKLSALGRALSRLKWNVYLLDLPGFGSENLEKVYSVKDYSKFVATKSNRYFKGSSFFVFGHSNGGRVAIGMMKYFPKNIKGLVLCASGGISRPFFLKRWVFFLFAKIGKIFLVIPSFGKVFKKVLYRLAREHDYEKTDGLLKATLRNLLKENTKKNIKHVNKETLLLWGTMDKMTPFKDAKYLNKKIRKSTLVTFEGIGHKLPYIKPKSIASEIDLWFKKFI